MVNAPNRVFLYIAASAANIATFICGTALGWTSPEIPLLKNITTSPLDHELSVSEEGWIGSFLPLAAAIGPIGGGILANLIGRKKTILMGAIPFLAAFALNIFAQSVLLFYLSRFICGFGVGIIFTAMPMYIGEISDNETRGTLGSFLQLFAVLGLLFSYALGPFISIKMFNIILVCIPFIFVVLFFFFIPESPYYLIQSGKIEEAITALSKFRGMERKFAEKEAETVKLQVENDLENKGGLRTILTSVGLRKALIIAFSLLAAQQLSGINIVLFYTQNIFTDAGVSLAPEICTIIVGIVQIVASAATPLLVDRCGKRFLLMLSGLGMALSHSVLAFFFYMKDDCQKDISNLAWLPIVGVIVYIITYCLGFGPLPWAVLGEIFPGNVKSVASSASASFCWILGFIVTNYFSALVILVGTSGTFGFFSICCVTAALYVFKCVPETSGKSCQEIQIILEGSKNGESS
ncbi:facilitated trehalose transporter Tret1-like [Diabrotica virgifera virgifera]|uniref:Major facilitator superfamily (MFS) profile domain-containing protein n=1 Tax=Diabrotica virgifera virgifera TaxID=50390 RepID=A0ABM5K8W6_DIAVI|nr:facilitated trehalose transporter Tret1-like [Diabrotica virgifera virgifera]